MRFYRLAAFIASLAAVTFAVVGFSPGLPAGERRSVVLTLAAAGPLVPVKESDSAAAATGVHGGFKIPESQAGGAVESTRSVSPADQSAPPTPEDGRAAGEAAPFADSEPNRAAGDSAADAAAEGAGPEASGNPRDKEGAAPAGVDPQRLADVLAAYHARLVDLIEGQKHYPEIARRLRHEGNVQVRFRLAADGELLSSGISIPCAHAELDEAALAAVRAVPRYPQFPGELGVGAREFVVTLSFRLE